MFDHVFSALSFHIRLLNLIVLVKFKRELLQQRIDLIGDELMHLLNHFLRQVVWGHVLAHLVHNFLDVLALLVIAEGY